MTIDTGWIILTLLSINGVRNIIAYLGWVPINSGRLSKFIYARSDEKIIEKALINLGYEKQEIDQIVTSMSKSRLKEVRKMTNKVCYRKLIKIIRKCLISTDQMRYGGSTTQYYIHTMMGSQNEDILEEMSELLIYQITQDYLPNFVITPKSGNPLLGRYIAAKLGAQCILYKDPNERSYARNPNAVLGNDNPELDFEINFEGAYYLDREKPLKGVVVDCNTSGGTQLLNATKAFNNIIEKKKLPFKKIQNIYTLFKVDDDHQNIDEYFNQNGGLKLHRIFDMTEDIKTKIASLNSEDIHIYNKDSPEVDKIISLMYKKELLHLSTDQSK